MTIELVEQPARWVAGLATRTRNADEMQPERSRLYRLWQRAAREGETMVAVLTDYESGRDGEYTQLVGRAITDPTRMDEGQLAAWIPQAVYARVIAEGELPEAIIEGWRRIWAAEESGELRRACRTDFEIWAPSRAPEIYVSIET